MLLRQFNIKVVFALVSAICASSTITYLAAAEIKAAQSAEEIKAAKSKAAKSADEIKAAKKRYAYIWKVREAEVKAAAQACFTKLLEDDSIVENVTKHVLTHLKTPSELPVEQFNQRRLDGSILVWLSYESWSDKKIAVIRQLLVNLYETGDYVTRIKKWMENKSRALTEDNITDFRFLLNFRNCLRDYRGEIITVEELSHYASVNGGEISDHTLDNMQVIGNFIDFFNKIKNDDVRTFLEKCVNCADPLKELLVLQKALFECMNLMTRRVMKECFEPCVKATMLRAFSLPGITRQRAAMKIQENMKEAQNGIEQTQIEDEETGNRLETIEVVYKEDGDRATTEIHRMFPNGSAFTQFMRAVILDTEPGGTQEFTLAPNVVRVPNVVDYNDSTTKTPGKLSAFVKAEIEKVDGDGANETDYIADDETSYTTTYNVELVSRRVSELPFIASVYYGVDSTQ